MNINYQKVWHLKEGMNIDIGYKFLHQWLIKSTNNRVGKYMDMPINY